MKCFIAFTVVCILIDLSVQEELLIVSSWESSLGFSESNKGEFLGTYSKRVEDCNLNTSSVILFEIATHRPYSYFKFTSPANLRSWMPFTTNNNDNLVYAKFHVKNDGPCQIDAEVYVQP